MYQPPGRQYAFNQDECLKVTPDQYPATLLPRGNILKGNG
jgi:hypothetical protein